jgi:hypothetical protein
MLELLATDLAVGLVIALIIYLAGATYGLSRHYLSTRTSVPIV